MRENITDEITLRKKTVLTLPVWVETWIELTFLLNVSFTRESKLAPRVTFTNRR